MKGQEHQQRIRKLLFWRQIAASTAAEIIIVFAILWWFDDDYDPGVKLYEVAIGVGLIWVAQLILGLKNWIAMMLSLQFFEPKLIQAGFLETLRNSKFPPPHQIHAAARYDYLVDLVDDSDLAPDVRIRAAALHGACEATKFCKGNSASFVLEQAWDAAVREYNNEQAVVN